MFQTDQCSEYFYASDGASTSFMGKFLVVYFDDILIYSKSREQHLGERKLYANSKKCMFLSTQVQFLGFVVSTDGVFADPEKVRAIEKWPEPKIIRDLRSFHSLMTFYRQFIKRFSIIMTSITDCLKRVNLFGLALSRKYLLRSRRE